MKTLANILIAISFVGGITIDHAAYSQESPPAPENKTSFECVSNRGVPTTIVIGSFGEKPMISWISNHFGNDGWTPEMRCKEVTARITRAYETGNLKFFTTGRVNGMPVICSTSQEGGGCESLIYTLKPTQNPAQTLSDLLKVRSGARGPIAETSERPYIPLSSFTGGADFHADKIERAPLKGGNVERIF